MPGGVNSANLFAMLDEGDSDDDSAPVQKQAAPAKPAAKKEEPKKADVAKNKGGGKGDRREPRGKRDNNSGHDNAAYDGSDKPTKPSEKEGRGKGERRERGEKGERKGKGKGSRTREFDRHVSGTGRGKGEGREANREGRGKYNWGEKTDTDAPADEAEGQEGENKPRRERAPRAEEAPEEPEEEEEPTMTFEEYMKSKENTHVGPVLEARQVTAEATGFQFTRGDENADAVVGCLFNDSYDGKHHEHESKHAREGTVAADKLFNMKFVDPNAGNKGGDDRRSKGKGGSGKGGKGAQGGRGAKSTRAPAQQGPGKSLELDDANAFPSLA